MLNEILLCILAYLTYGIFVQDFFHILWSISMLVIWRITPQLCTMPYFGFLSPLAYVDILAIFVFSILSPARAFLINTKRNRTQRAALEICFPNSQSPGSSIIDGGMVVEYVLPLPILIVSNYD